MTSTELKHFLLQLMPAERNAMELLKKELGVSHPILEGQCQASRGLSDHVLAREARLHSIRWWWVSPSFHTSSPSEAQPPLQISGGAEGSDQARAASTALLPRAAPCDVEDLDSRPLPELFPGILQQLLCSV